MLSAQEVEVFDDPADRGDDPNYESMIASRFVSARQTARQVEARDYFTERIVLYNVSGYRFTLNGRWLDTARTIWHDEGTDCEFFRLQPFYNYVEVQSRYNLSCPAIEAPVHTKLSFENALKTLHKGLYDINSTLDYHAVAIEDRAANNLGGLGPNNYSYCGRTIGAFSFTRDDDACYVDYGPARAPEQYFSYPSPGRSWTNYGPNGEGEYVNHKRVFYPQGNYQSHPNFIRLNDVAYYNKTRIAMRIDNTTEFNPANPRMNDFNGLNFQINQAPIFDIYAARSGARQPFKGDQTDFLARALDDFIQTALKVDLRAQNGNNVALLQLFRSGHGTTRRARRGACVVPHALHHPLSPCRKGASFASPTRMWGHHFTHAPAGQLPLSFTVHHRHLPCRAVHDHFLRLRPGLRG